MQSGDTALIEASLENHPDVVKLLLEHKADVDLKDEVRVNLYSCE